MVTLLITIATSVVLAIFATQNTERIALKFGDFTLSNVPTYLGVLIPLLIGLIIAFFLHIARDLSQNLTINEQKEKIETLKKEVAEVTKDAHKFQLENTRFKKDQGLLDDEDAI